MSASEDASPKKATTTRENPLEKIEQLLTCSICLDRFKHPKLLPCQHTFCLACLSSYMDSRMYRLKCPECRAEHPIDPYEGVTALPANLTLAGFLDIHLNAVDANAAEFRAYVETYNLERCKICGEKAQLEMCAHCERKTCEECRKTHIDSLKRDLARLLNQVKRLSNRLRDGSAGLDKSLTALLVNGESAKAEVHDYFHRYREELSQREAHFLSEADAFLESERRVMLTLRDTLAVEAANVDEACAWTDAVLTDTRKATDAELSNMKIIFTDAIDYLRNFQPDSDEIFGKKLRFSPGDDASKLPSAIMSFGEMTVCLPQCGNRYLPLEAHFLPKPLRMILESDMGRTATKDGQESSRTRSGTKAIATDDPYLRRLQFEEEAWSRLRAASVSPLATGSGSRTPIRHIPTPEAQLSVQPQQIEQAVEKPEKTEKELHIDITATAASGSSESKAPPSPSKIPKIASPNLRSVSPQSSQSTQNAMSPPENSSSKVVASTSKLVEPTTGAKPTAIGSKKSIQKQCSREKSKLRKQSIESESTGPDPSKQAQSPKIPETKTKSVESSANSHIAASKVSLSQNQEQLATSSKNELAEELPQIRVNNNNKNKNSNNSQALCLARVEAPAAETILPPPKNVSGCSTENKNEYETAKKDILTVPTNTTVELNGSADQGDKERATQAKTAVIEKHRRPHEKPPLPRQRSSQDPDQSLNEKVDRIRKNHERINEHIDRIRRDHEAWNNEQQVSSSCRMRSRSSSVISVDEDSAANTSGKLLQVNEGGLHSKFKSRILYRSSLSRPIGHNPLVGDENRSENNYSKPERKCLEEIQVIPITHYPTNSCGEWPQSERRFSRSKTNPNLQIDGLWAEPARSVSRSRQLMAQRSRESNGEAVSKRANQRRSCWRVDSNHSSQSRTSNDDSNNYTAKQTPITIVGKRGAELGSMNWPRGVAALPEDEFIVCDSANHRVQIFELDGRRVTSFGSYGNGPGQFDGCAGVAYHPYRKQLIVTDRYNHRVQIFDRDGQFVRQFGGRGTAPGQFNSPWGVAVDEVGLVYVADKDNHRVQVFDRTGRFMHSFGRLGNALGQFNHPLFIAIQPHIQHIFVSDSANHRVCIHAQDGTPLRAIGTEGCRNGELKLPRGIAVDAQGHVIVADSGNNRVQVFKPDDSSLTTFGAWGSAPGQLKGIEGVALAIGSIGSEGRIISADRENHRVQIF